MNNKKCRLFLWVSFAFFTLSLIAIISSIIVSYYKVKIDFPYDPAMVMNEFGFALIVVMWIIIPFLGVELSFIRSVYKMLKHKPKGFVKICYMISSLLALLAFAFYCLTSIGLIPFDEIMETPNPTFTILFFTEWPSFILSLILGSIPIKHDSV